MLALLIVGLVALVVALAWRWRVRRRVARLGYSAFCYLSGREGGGVDRAALFLLLPRGAERREWARVLATLAHTFADCRGERVGALSVAWGIEEWLLGRVESRRRWVQQRALEQLLLLSPSQRALQRVERCSFRHPTTRFLQLLHLVYAKPSKVVALVKYHPHRLTWSEVGRVVEVLKRRGPILELPKSEGMATHNTELLMLYLAQVEGVGDVREVARGLTDTVDTPLQRAALNTLWSDSRYPRME